MQQDNGPRRWCCASPLQRWHQPLPVVLIGRQWPDNAGDAELEHRRKELDGASIHEAAVRENGVSLHIMPVYGLRPGARYCAPHLHPGPR